MNPITASTVTVQTTSTSIPSTPCWFGEAVIISQSLRRSGPLTKMAERIHFARRRFGQYEVIDFLTVLFGYALSGERTLETFSERVHPFAQPFMASLGESDCLPDRRFHAF